MLNDSDYCAPTIYDAYLAARVVVYAEPTVEPIDTEEVMDERRNDDDSDVLGIARRVTAARQKVEADTGRALITQTLDIYFDEFPDSRELWIPRPRLATVASVTTYDTSDVATVWSSTNYLVDTASEPGRIVLNASSAWPTGLRRANGIKVRVAAGYGATGDSVPSLLKQAMHLLIGQYDEHRENVIVAQFAGQFLELPHGYEDCIAPYRVMVF